MREAAIQRRIKTWLERLPYGFRVRKLADRYTRGYPDLQVIGVTPDGHLFLLEIEVKQPNGKVSPVQEVERDRMTTALRTMRQATTGGGGRAALIVATCVNEVRPILEKWGFQL